MPSFVFIASSSAAGIAAMFLLKKYYFDGGSCKNQVRLDGKIAVITGANAGLGKETALELARRGATVVMACRNIARATHAAVDIRAQLGSKCNVIVRELDLSSLASVRRFAEQINETLDGIHLLINNAGVVAATHAETEDGFEMTMATNHLGHFLLTHLLLDKMKKAAPSRIITVSSRAYERSTLNVDYLFGTEQNNTPSQCYRDSKLANILFTKELAVRLRGSGVVAYCLHPGVVRTEIMEKLVARQSLAMRLVIFLMSPLFWVIGKSPHQGAQTTIYCATEPLLNDEIWSGSYFADCAVQKLLPHAEDMGVARRLWAVSEKLTMQ